MNILRNTIMGVSVFGLLTAASLQANAESVTEVTAPVVAQPTEIRVSFDDLDLTSAEGMETLHYRLANAARQACGSSDLRRVGSLQIANRNEVCFEASLSRAMSDIPAAQMASSQ